jgi:hypothetical protein
MRPQQSQIPATSTLCPRSLNAIPTHNRDSPHSDPDPPSHLLEGVCVLPVAAAHCSLLWLALANNSPHTLQHSRVV